MKKLTKLLFVVLLITSSSSFAQEVQDSLEQQDKQLLEKIVSPSIVKLSGEAGVYGELYSISGRENRRPPTSGRIFFRPTLTLFENFSINFDIMLSTEGSSARQQLNQIGLHPEWGWGKAHLGDFNHEFSKFTLSGVTIRGAGFEFYPGIFRIHIVGGQTQRAVQTDAYSSTYSRYMGGLKLGVGKNEGSFFDLNIIRVRDNVASLPKDMFRRDSSTSTNQFGVSPQENLTIGANTEIKLFENMLRFGGEVAASVFTRDMFSTTFTKQEIEDNKLPGFIDNIFKLRLSTNADFAYDLNVNFNYKIFNMRAAYTVINPGYTSLGLGSFINDKRNIQLNAGIRLFENKVAVQGNFQFQNDNLLKQKLNTLSRMNYGVSVNIRPVNELSLSLNTMQNSMSNDAINDTIKVNNINSSYTLNAVYQLILFKMNNAITASYSTQLAEDLNILRKGNEVTSGNFAFSINTTLNSSWSVSPGVNFNSVEIKNRSKTTTAQYNLRVNNKISSIKLNNSLMVGYSDATTISSIVATLQSGYSLTPSDNISFTYRLSSYTGKGSTKSYNENKANISFIHRF